MKKTLILDEATWRCGQDSCSKNSRGYSETCLENDKGFLCCLGQFSRQIDKKIGDMVDLFEPCEINAVVSLLTKKEGCSIVNTKLSKSAMEINDDETTTVEEKVKKLKTIFKRRGVSIIFKRKK